MKVARVLPTGDGRDHHRTVSWVAVFPVVTTFVASLWMTTLGYWFRDRLDPTVM